MYLILLTIIFAICPTLAFYKFYNPVISSRSKLFLIIFVIIDVLISFYINSSIIIPLTLLIFIVIGFFENKKAVAYNLSITILCLMLYFLSDSITYIILNKILNIEYMKTTGGILLYGLVIICIIYIFSSLLDKFLNELLKEKFSPKNVKQFIVITLNVIFSFVIIYLNYIVNKVYIGSKDGIYNVVDLFLIIGYMISTIATAYFFSSSYQKQIKLQLEEEEKQRVIEHSEIVEEMYLSLRKFKHDYVNILLSLNDYIDEKRWSELEIYFKENILDTKEFVSKSDSIAKLCNLKITYLKALVSSKIIKAESFGIRTYVDVAEEVTSLPINPVDMCRALGILLDNSIEGALESSDKILSFGIVYKSNSIIVAVENSCVSNLPPLFKLTEKNFSTKGINRGLGLFNFKEILNKYNNITYNLEMEDSWFISEIWMRIS